MRRTKSFLGSLEHGVTFLKRWTNRPFRECAEYQPWWNSKRSCVRTVRWNCPWRIFREWTVQVWHKNWNSLCLKTSKIICELTTCVSEMTCEYVSELSECQFSELSRVARSIVSHRQKSRTFCSRIHWSAEYVILQWDKNKMAARTSKTDQGRDKFHTKYWMI